MYRKILVSAFKYLGVSLSLLNTCEPEVIFLNTCVLLTHFELIMLYKILNNLAPDYLKELIPPLASRRSSRALRNSLNIHQIKSKNKYFRDSFLPSTISKWNSLPSTKRNSPSLAVFRSELNKIMGPCRPPIHYYYGESLRKPGIILA